MKILLAPGLFITLLFACSRNKNLAKSEAMSVNDSLVQLIDKSSRNDTDIINPKLRQLQQENDLVISFGTLNFAWARRGSFYVLAEQNKTWKLYRFDSKLPPSADDASVSLAPLEVNLTEAQNIKSLYTKAHLWQTEGDDGKGFCPGKKDCNINDAETWTLSVATRNNIHTTSYYAPEFFEECCPGNNYRKDFITIGKAIMQLAPQQGGGVEQ